MTVPDYEARAQYVHYCLFSSQETQDHDLESSAFAKLRLDDMFDFNALAKAAPGYVGAHLSALTGHHRSQTDLQKSSGWCRCHSQRFIIYRGHRCPDAAGRSKLNSCRHLKFSNTIT